MKTFHFVAIALLCTFFSCTKETKDVLDRPDEPGDAPRQLVKRISRYELNGVIYEDSTAFNYDAAGHLIATVDPKTKLPTRRFIYEGDNLIALIDYNNDKLDTLQNPVKLLDGGNT